MKVDPNHDEIEALRKRVADLEDLLVSAREICRRRGADTAWERFDAQIAKRGIGWVTPRTFKVLRHDHAMIAERDK